MKAIGKFILLEQKEFEYSVVYHHWYDLTLSTRIKKEGTGVTKSCPGKVFFRGNSIDDFRENLLPMLI